jgi:hypothetical protein
MKPAFDLLQILLSCSIWIVPLIVCAVLTLLILQALKAVGVTLSALNKIRAKVGLRFTKLHIAAYASLALIMFLARLPIHDGLQWIEQRYISPVYAVNDTSMFALEVYERELKKHVNESEFQIVQSETRRIASRLGCSPLALYEVAYCECALDPFRIRDDGTAAGWIQFTRTGLKDLNVSLERVKQACRDKDAAFIMALTEQYLVSAAKGNPLPTSTDVYVAVAAPGHVGKGPDAILYTRADGDAYAKNAALWDGWRVSGKKVVRDRVDGVITIADLSGALALKKAQLLKR